MFRFENYVFPIAAIIGVHWNEAKTKIAIWVVSKAQPFELVGEQAARCIGAWEEMFPDPERATQQVAEAQRRGSPLGDIVIQRAPLKPYNDVGN